MAEHEVILRGRGPGVPGFGESGGAFAELIDVSGAVGLGGHVEKEVPLTGIGESAHDVGEADVAGSDTVVIVTDGLDKIL